MQPINSLMIMLRSIENFINCPVFIKSGSFSELLVLSSANCGSFPQSNHFREKFVIFHYHDRIYYLPSANEELALLFPDEHEKSRKLDPSSVLARSAFLLHQIILKHTYGNRPLHVSQIIFEIVHCVAKLAQKLPISRHIFDAYLTSL
ncbi:unnamed protein product [Rhizophagus irregularis]|nr:unnamed protein product [Rhizophagus irregularis]